MMIPSGRQAWLDAMEPQLDGMPPTIEKSKQLHPGRQVAHAPQTAPAGHGPQAQSTSLGRQFMTAVVVQGCGSGAGQFSPVAQVAPLEELQPDPPTFTHW
jgi:hypothetical protein